MNDGRNPWLFQGAMPAALWANWWLLSLQTMHTFNQAFLRIAAGSWAGSLKATRTFHESISIGISPPNGQQD